MPFPRLETPTSAGTTLVVLGGMGAAGADLPITEQRRPPQRGPRRILTALSYADTPRRGTGDLRRR